MPMAKDDAGQRLDLEVLQGRALLLREVAHLRLGELDVVKIAFGDLRYRALDLLRRELERCGRPLVVCFRQFASRSITPGFDISKNLLDGLAHLRVGRFDRARVHPALEPTWHVSSPCSAA